MEHIGIEDVPARLVAVVRRTVPVDGLGPFYVEATAAVEKAVERAGGVLAGPLFGWYHESGAEVVDVSAGFPVSGLSIGVLDGEVEIELRAGGLAAVVVHTGPYDALPELYRKVRAWIDARQLDPSPECWEEYLTDGDTNPDPATWETRLVRPLV